MIGTGKLKSDKIWIEFLAIPYVAGFGLIYSVDPLALAPQLDAKENLLWAQMIMDGSLPDQPFYRAMLYPLFIGIIKTITHTNFLLPVFGLILHVGIAFQVRYITGIIWNSKISGRFSYFLYILNPVALFYAAQIMDISMGMALFLAALQLLISVNAPSRAAFVFSGIVAGLACLTRPHFLPAAIILAAIPVITGKGHISGRWIAPVYILLGLGCMLLIQGVANLAHSGEFRILPWQGAYNLYAANREGANGLYFQQKVDVTGKDFINPAQAEAAQLYGMQTGKQPPFSVREQTTYWKNQATGLIAEEPVRLLKLLLFKTYAVFNSHEAYNNVTYGYHKDRLTFLRYNPMNFGLLLILASMGSLILFQLERSNLIALWLLLLGYSVSLVLYYVSAKFRIPLVPLLTILAGGVFSHWKLLLASRSRQLQAGGIAMATAFVTFSSFAGIRNNHTIVQDRLLLANAHADLGHDEQALTFAMKVLKEHPARAEALRIYTISYFNMQLVGDPAVNKFGPWEDQKQWIIHAPPTDPVQDAVIGVFYWKWMERERALSVWNTISRYDNEGTRLANACLDALSGKSTSDPLTLGVRRLLDQKD